MDKKQQLSPVSIAVRRVIAPFRQKAFKWLILASIISGAGNALIPVAFAIESIRIEASGWGISAVLMALWGGRFLGLWGYRHFAEKYNAVALMIAADGVKIAAQCGLLLWIYAMGNSILAMAVSSFVYGLAAAFFMPSMFVAIPTMIPESIRSEANSWLSVTGDIYGIVGPLMGSVVVIVLGFEAVLLFDIVTFLISLICLLLLFKYTASTEKSQVLQGFATELTSPASVVSVNQQPLEVSSNHHDTEQSLQRGLSENDLGKANLAECHLEDNHLEKEYLFNQSPEEPELLESFPLEHEVTEQLQGLPYWVLFGLVSWFFCALAIGLMGVAGPSLIIVNHSAQSWALVASMLAVGSLVGSGFSLLVGTHRWQWQHIHFLCGLGLGLQLYVLTLPVSIWLICIFAFLGAAVTTASGIQWDTLGQAAFSDKQLHRFASLDQLVNTVGIPTGMVLFGLSGWFEDAVILTTWVAILAFLSALPLLFTPARAMSSVTK